MICYGFNFYIDPAEYAFSDEALRDRTIALFQEMLQVMCIRPQCIHIDPWTGILNKKAEVIPLKKKKGDVTPPEKP